ncbi:MAG TPA: transmembrane 220 family protein [Flavisolibacter sp.]|nr:transmembrane 220 family protein [Flavisolibacter sp.]HWJ91852.1 transmembrane 220 family protein [Flavisolibacter sp.]
MHNEALNIFFVVLFLFSAALQYNDPDPYIWMPVYLYGAWLCFRAIRGKNSKALYMIGFAVYGSYALFLVFDKTGVIDWIGEHHAEKLCKR